MRKLTLSGHEDWVRCLALASYFIKDSDIPGHLILASGSQDGSIRLWLIKSLSATSPLAVVHDAKATHDQILDSIPDDSKYAVDSSSQIESKQHVFKLTTDDTPCVFFS
jgi:elongator complex protein 2